MSDLLIEVSAKPSGELGGPTLPSKVKFDEYADIISTSLTSVAERFQESLTALRPSERGWSPDEVQVEFCLSVEASGNIIVAQGKAGGTFSATITWRRGKDDQ